jgi:KDO2-lipid IV(A) lauroyltransferase
MNADSSIETASQPENSVSLDGNDPGQTISSSPTLVPTTVKRAPARFKLERRHEFRYHLSVACAIACSWIVRIVPERPRNWIADRGGDFFFRFSPTYRRNVSANIAQVVGEPEDSANVRAMTRSVFRASGRNFADLLVLPHLSAKQVANYEEVVSGDWSIVERALERGKGAVIVTAHVGSFEFLGKTLHHRGYKTNSITARTTARFLFDAVTYLRRARGSSVVEASPSGIRRIIQAIRRGECAVFLSDRDFFQNGLPVMFFGKETTLPPGAVRIARDTGAPIVPIFAIRKGDRRGIMIEPSFEVEKSRDLDGDLSRGMARLVEVLENAIGSLPDQWVMFQRAWPLEPADPVRVFPIGSPLETDVLERVGAALPGAGRSRGKRRQDQDSEPKDRTAEHP